MFPKKSRREIFQRIFALGIFWCGVSRYAATPLIVALYPGYADIYIYIYIYDTIVRVSTSSS